MVIHRTRLLFTLALTMASTAATTGALAKKPWVFFNFPNATSVVPIAISGHNHIVGNYQKNAVDYLHAFLRTPDGTVAEISVPGSPLTVAVGVNLGGAIVGYCADQNGKPHGYIRDANGNYQTVDYPGANTSTLMTINESGTVAGTANINASQTIGFLRKPDGTFAAITPPSSVNAIPAAINQRGTVAGSFTDQQSKTHGFLRSHTGRITVFDVPGAVETHVASMNAKDEIAGYFSLNNAGPLHSFVRAADGTITTFDPTGPGIAPAAGSTALSINYFGEIAGSFIDTSNVSHGFVREPEGSFIQLDAPGASAAGTSATAIGVDGKIAGYTANEGGFRLNRKEWKGQ